MSFVVSRKAFYAAMAETPMVRAFAAMAERRSEGVEDPHSSACTCGACACSMCGSNALTCDGLCQVTYEDES